jgi:hypothetical protein
MHAVSRILIPIVIACLPVWAAAASDASDWIDYGLLPDGTMYRWTRGSATTVSPGVFDVWSRAEYAAPRPVPGDGAGQRASSVQVRQRVFCSTREVQALWFSYYDADGATIASSTREQERKPTRPDSVGGRLVASVCQTLLATRREAP